jgi:hypothetical protein
VTANVGARGQITTLSYPIVSNHCPSMCLNVPRRSGTDRVSTWYSNLVRVSSIDLWGPGASQPIAASRNQSQPGSRGGLEIFEVTRFWRHQATQLATRPASQSHSIAYQHKGFSSPHWLDWLDRLPSPALSYPTCLTYPRYPTEPTEPTEPPSKCDPSSPSPLDSPVESLPLPASLPPCTPRYYAV